MFKPSIPSSRALRGTAVLGVVAAVLATAFPQTSSAASGHDSQPAATQQAASTSSSFPTFVHLPADQAAHSGFAEEWWYTVGHISAHGHQYGYEVQLTAEGLVELAITDITAGKYYTHQLAFPAGQFSVSSTELDVQFPDASLTGPMNAMHLTATLPQGSLSLNLDAVGPVLYDNGTGLFPFLGGSSYYYSLPDVRTTGTLTLNGQTSQVTGKSWLDRQWGNWDWSQLDKWTWMSIQLGNGDSLDLWDLFDKQGEGHWATVLRPDGSESVVSVDPLAKDATDFQTSPTTGQTYAGKWTVRIPSLNTTLTVTASPVLQEVQAGVPFTPGINEAASTVTGVSGGRPVSGQAYVEQFGIWN
jgi:predicted secreted hydrolase